MAGAGGQEVGRISIRVVPDTDGFRKKLQAELKAIEDSLRATIEVDLDLDTAKARGEMRALMTKLKAEAAKGVKVNTDVAKSAKGLQLGLDPKFDYKLRQRLAKIKPKVVVEVEVEVQRSVLDRLREKITSATDGLWEGGGGASGAVGGLGSMGRVLAIVAAVAAVAAPALALISGVLVSLPAIISAVLIPIAAIALGLDGIKEAAKVLKEPFDHLKKTMSAKFKDSFSKPFADLTKLFPALEESMPKVATALGTVAQSFVDVVTSAPGLDKIKGVITNIADTITASAPGIGKLTDGLLGLANGVSSKFPAVGRWLDTVGDSFDKWVEKVSSPGIGAGVEGKSPLDIAMESLGGTLKGVLDIIGDLAKQGFDFLADPNFGDKMKDFVADCRTLLNDVLPGLKTMFMEMAGYVSTITDALDKVDKYKPPEWITGPKDKPQDPGVGAFPGVQPEPWTFEDGSTVAEKIKQKWGELSAWFTNWWTQMKTGASDMWASISNGVTTAVERIKGAWNTVISWFGTTGSQLSGSLAQTWNTISSQAATAFSGIPGAFSNAWATLTGIAQIVWNAVVTIVQQKAQELVTTVQTKGAEIAAEIATWPGKFVAALGDLGGLLVDAGANLVQGLINGIKNKIGEAVAAAADLAGRVAAAAKGALGIHSPSTVFAEIGDNTMQGLLNGIDENGQNVVDKAKALAEQIATAMQNGMQGIAPSMKDQLDQTKDQLDLQQKNLQIMSKGTEDKGQKQALQDRIDQLSQLKKQLDPKSFGTGTTDQLNQTLDQLELQRKALKVDLNAVPKDDKEGRKALQSQIDQLQAQKDQLNLQKDQLAYSEEYGGSLESNDSTMTDTLSKMVNAGKGFAESNIKQFTSDIGISGNGAISQGLEQGIGFGMSMLSKLFSGGGTTINVGSVDDALTAKNTLANKQALQYTGR